MNRCVLLLAVIVTSGCGTETPEMTSRSVQGDTVFVHNDEPILSDTLTPQLIQTWGVFDGDPDLILSEVQALAPSEDGGIWVHSLNQGVRRFSADGSTARFVYPPGEGPTEVRYVRAITSDGAGSVAAWDLGNQKLILRTATGDSILRAPRRWNAYDEHALQFDAEGALWLKFGLGSDEAGSPFPRPIFARLNSAGGLSDTISVGDPASPCALVYDFKYRNGYWLDVRVPWHPTYVTALTDRAELVEGCNDEFAFRVYREDGTVLEIAKAHQRLEVSDYARSYFGSFPAGMPPIPAERPFYSRIIAEPSGRFWVWPTHSYEYLVVPEHLRASAPADSVPIHAQSKGAFAVFESDGTWLANVGLPEGVVYSGYPTTPNVVIRGDTLWAIRFGDYGEEYVGKYLIPFT